MQFRTPLLLPPSHFLISHHDAIVSIGSCFADVMGKYLTQFKFDVCSNPFGNIYQPISIFQLLSLNEILQDDNFIQQNGQWYNFQLHSEISAATKDELKRIITEIHQNFIAKLTKASFLIVTLGTAWVYQQKDNGNLVANCHKVIAQKFDKKLLDINTIQTTFETFHEQLLKLNPKIRLLFTVSPVRHIKDTLELNSVSKALLRIFCHQMISTYNHIDYFPSYEIMMDDLRDYRFYEKDMIHPNEIAHEYIWESFSKTWLQPDTIKTCIEWQKVSKSISHKPFQPKSEAYQEFLKNTLIKLKSFEHLLDVNSEIQLIQEKIAKNVL